MAGIGIFVCDCDGELSERIDLEALGSRLQEHPDVVSELAAWTEDAVFGQQDYEIGEDTLAYEMASRQIVAGDVEDAAEFVHHILRRADDPKQKLRSIRASRTRRAPLGPIPKKDRSAFLKSLTDAERTAIVRTHETYLRNYDKAIALAGQRLQRDRRK